jgi:hypothetical protein
LLQALSQLQQYLQRLGLLALPPLLAPYFPVLAALVVLVAEGF